MDTNHPPRTVLNLARCSKFAHAALLGIGVVCLGLIASALLTSCSALDSAVSTAKSAVAVVDGSSNDLLAVTVATKQAVGFEPALAPYVQTVANYLHAHATATAPNPAIVAIGLSGLSAIVPGLNAITGPVTDFYQAHYATLAAADGKAGPLIEQLAGAVEAGAGPVTGLKVISNPAN